MPRTVHPPHAVLLTCALTAEADPAEVAERIGVVLSSSDPRGLIDAWAAWTGERALEVIAVFQDAERAETGRDELARIVAGKTDGLRIAETRAGPAVNLPGVARGNKPVRLAPIEVPLPEELGR